MQHLIKDGQTVEQDEWILIDAETDVPAEGPVILPLTYYREQRSEWQADGRAVGVWLNDEEFPEDITDLLEEVGLIALHFPKFADGRSFSKARLIRERLGYQGEIRAIGDFLPDQAFYLQRCGVNAFACRTAEEAATTSRLLDTFSVRYQADVSARPLFDQR